MFLLFDKGCYNLKKKYTLKCFEYIKAMQKIQQKRARTRARRVNGYVGNIGHRKHPKLQILQMVPAATQEQRIQVHRHLGERRQHGH